MRRFRCSCRSSFLNSRISSRHRGSKPSNFAILLVFLTSVTFYKINLLKRVYCSLTTRFSGPKSFRDFRERDPRSPTWRTYDVIYSSPSDLSSSSFPIRHRSFLVDLVLYISETGRLIYVSVVKASTIYISSFFSLIWTFHEGKFCISLHWCFSGSAITKIAFVLSSGSK